MATPETTPTPSASVTIDVTAPAKATGPTVIDHLRSAHARNRRLEKKSAVVNRVVEEIRAENKVLALKLAVAEAKLNSDDSAHRRVTMLEERMTIVRTVLDLDTVVRMH